MPPALIEILPHQKSPSAFSQFTRELFVFGMKESLSCLFPAFIFLVLFISKFMHLSFLPRYDFLLLACVSMQALMYITRMETLDELLVICLFHLIGLCMELYKVRMGSWSYPEPAYTKIFGVPLYSGFMYASVASYICQAWRRFDLKVTGWPGDIPALFVAAIVYVNFFSHHFIYDLRYMIMILMFIVFFKTKILFTPIKKQRSMPLLLSFVLIGFFVWIAENIATFFGAWQYTYQHAGWHMVASGKITSWFLMIVISIIIVIELKFIKERRR